MNLDTVKDMEKKWYALHTYTGYENRVKQTIEHRVQLENMLDLIEEVKVPLRKALEIKNGKKREIMRNVMPGYVFIKMEANDLLFGIIKNISGVSGFLGEDGKPLPVDLNEMGAILDTEEKNERPKTVITYQVSDQVKVVEGPFANFVGSVEQVDQEKGKLKVMVSIFGRPTSVELDVLQVEAV